MKVALHVGQLRQPIPGGIGAYVRALLAALPPAGVTLSTFGFGRGETTWPEYRDLGRPRPPLRYSLWHGLRRPRVRVNADLVHAPTLAIPPTHPTPLVATVHDVAFLRFPEASTRHGVRFHRRGLKLARRRASAVVVPSAFTASELVAEGFDPELLFVAPHGAPVVRSRPDLEVDAVLDALQVPTPFVLAVGTLEPRKGLRTLFAAFAELRLRDVTLVVAGPPGWGDVRVPDDVLALGSMGPDALDALYRRAAACAVPSVYEGFGLPALEAMAYGTPVVVSDTASLPEVVGNAGRLVPAGDVDAWAETLASVVFDADARRRLSAAGRARAESFTWTRSATAHLDAYRAALERSP